MYLDQVRDENAQTKKDVSIHGMEGTYDLGGVSLDEQYIEVQDKRYAKEAIALLKESNLLTETQRRRFTLHIIDGLSLRETARLEGVTFHAIAQSINAVLDKLKNVFDKLHP